MKEVSIAPGLPVLDVCNRCQLFWFDPGEYELVPKTEPRTIESKHEMLLRLQRAEMLRPHEVKRLNWQFLCAFFGLPVELAATRVRRRPVITLWSAGTICILSLLSFIDLRHMVELFAFVPANPWRLGGITILTVGVLHNDPWHLFGNLYFLLVFGDNVEDFLGRRNFAALLLLAIVGADAVHTLVDPRSTVPLIGASGGISGVMTFYALRFPKARMLVPLSRRSMSTSAWAAFLGWGGLQVIGLVAQAQGVSAVSAAAHIGGALVGVLFWAGEEAYSRRHLRAEPPAPVVSR
jgi:membrane associated rhomboid family serine protease